ncbi:MAG: N-glycosylase/DNA lyase [Candidatus Woesearchaeota archaeon]|nr:N-glycosylase/DNA lyase [Candidatus Woesearchaeota archaeon]
MLLGFVKLSSLIKNIRHLKRSDVRKAINKKIREFRSIGKRNSKELFKELCFCILTANFNAERSIKIQKEIGNGFITLPKKKLEKRLRRLGHRFPKTRAEYIANARRFLHSLREIVNSFDDEYSAREWIVKNIKGLGYKEASHFLRNIGFKNLAIIDFHIIDLLAKNKLIKRPKTLTKRRYLEIENILKKIGKKLNLSLAELDLYLWYMETGKVLK